MALHPESEEARLREIIARLESDIECRVEVERELSESEHLFLGLVETVASRPVFDEAAIRSVFHDDEDAIRELIAMIAVDLPRYGARLTACVERWQWMEVARLAHTIKGAASNVSGTAVVAAASAMEHAAKHEDATAITSSRRDLSAAIAALIEALNAWGRSLVCCRKADAA